MQRIKPISRTLLAAAAVTLGVVVLSAPGVDLFAQPTTQPTTQPAEGEDAATAFAAMALSDHMKVLNVDVRALRLSLIDPEKNAESIEMVKRMQRHALAAKDLKPTKMDFIKDEAEKAKLLKDYQIKMAQTVSDLLHIEIGLLSDDNEMAQAHYKAVLEHRFLGHNQFRVDD